MRRGNRDATDRAADTGDDEPVVHLLCRRDDIDYRRAQLLARGVSTSRLIRCIVRMSSVMDQPGPKPRRSPLPRPTVPRLA